MLKVGIIGAGRMGKAHAGNLAKLKSVTLTAVYDIVPAQAFADVRLNPGDSLELLHFVGGG